MYNHNKAQQSKYGVQISWDILYSGDTFIKGMETPRYMTLKGTN